MSTQREAEGGPGGAPSEFDRAIVDTNADPEIIDIDSKATTRDRALSRDVPEAGDAIV